MSLHVLLEFGFRYFVSAITIRYLNNNMRQFSQNFSHFGGLAYSTTIYCSAGGSTMSKLVLLFLL